MKKNKREKLFGVPPEVLNVTYHTHDTFTAHKSSKKGKVSFLVTKALLDNLWETSIKIQKQPKLILEIANEYTITCSITKK